MDTSSRIARAAGLLAGAWLAASAQAAVVFDGGAPLHNGGFYADSSALWTRSAARATLPAVTSFDGFQWWGVYFDGMGGLPELAQGIDDFNLRIYTVAGGLPGVLLKSLPLGAATRSYVGSYRGIGDPDYAYSASFPALTLAAGDYYFSLADDDGVASTAWAWETSFNLFGGQGVASSKDGGLHWDNTGSESFGLAFALTAASVPEPSTLLLLAAAGLAACGASRARLSWAGRPGARRSAQRPRPG